MKKLVTIMLCLSFFAVYTHAYEIGDFLEMLKDGVDLDTLINEGNRSSNTNLIDSSKYNNNYDNDYYNDYDYYPGDTHSDDSNDGNSSDILSNGFTRELTDAYNFAYENGITTQNSIFDANMYGGLTRIAMAKMLSEYAINVLGYGYDDTQDCYFSDISYDLSQSYNYGDCKAYSLGIMGQNLRNNQFRPYDKVTRAEFATALSRLLYNTPDGTDYYYSTHIRKLHENGIINDTNPNLSEIRGYIMLMLMRATK